MVAMLDVKGGYSNGAITFEWRCPAITPIFVFIYPIKREAGVKSLRPASSVRLRNSAMGCSINHPAGASVEYREFCVFAADAAVNGSEVEKLLDKPEYLVRVVTGDADVKYREEIKPFPSLGLKRLTLSLDSTAAIAEGIAGYAYDHGGRRIEVAFPGRVQAGLTKYPPIFVPQSAVIEVTAICEPKTAVTFSRVAKMPPTEPPGGAKRGSRLSRFLQIFGK
jgi:hypothetical protein